MLARLIQFALTQRLLMLLAMLALIGGGWMAFKATPIDAFPDVSTTQVKIIVKAPGMTPEEVETRITNRIELEMLGIPNQTMLRSIAKYALTDITLDFAEGTDIFWARQQVAERLGAIWGDLPDGVEGGLAPMTTPLGEMFMFSIEGGDLTLEARRDLLDWTIRPALRAVPGVADVNALGGLVTSFEVVPDNARMAARGIRLADLTAAITANNRNDGAGRLSAGEEVLLVRSQGAIKTLEDLGAIVVGGDARQPVRVADIAEVRFGALTRYGAVTRNGSGEAVEGLVLALRGANAREVVRGIHAKLDELAPALPEGVSIDVFYDRGVLVDKAVHTVTKALIEATVLVLILLVLFLGDLRAALTVALILPLSALATFILMRQFGLSANLMSLGGLAIAIGMLVDAAVVVVENLVTQLNRGSAGGRLPRLHILYRATREVALPVSSGILVIIIVFLPLLTLQGLEGKLFMPVALTIVFALASSLLLSLTVIPVLASYLLGKGAGPVERGRGEHAEPWLVRILTRIYVPVLDWSLRHQWVLLSGALALLIAAGALYTQVGKSFMPTMDEGDLIVQLEKLPSINLAESIAIDQRVQAAILAEVPEVESIIARTGSDELGLDPMGLNQTDSFLVLKPHETWRFTTKDELMDAIRAVLDRFPGMDYAFTQPIEMRVSEMLTGVRGDLAVKIFGPDSDALNGLAERIVGVLEGIAGSQDVYTPRNEGAQYLNLVVDRLEAGRLGVDADALADLLRAQVEGLTVGTLDVEGKRRPLLVRGPEALRESPARFAGLQVSLPDGRAVPLNNLVRIERMEGPVAIARARQPHGGRHRQRRRPRPGGIRRRGACGGRRAGRAAARLSARMGRRVREPAARRGPSGHGGAGGAGADLPGALLDLRLGETGRSGPVERALRHDRRRLRAGPHRRISLGARLGRLHRPARHRGAERRGDGHLFQPAARARSTHAGGGRRRGKATPAPGAHDREHRGLRPGAAALRDRTRIGDPAPAGDRRHRRVGLRHPAHTHPVADPLPTFRRGTDLSNRGRRTRSNGKTPDKRDS
jgi:heavy metal efflux system protein